MAFENLSAAIVTASDAADRLISKAQSDAATLASVQQQLSDLDSQATQIVQPLVDTLTQAAPAPAVPDPSVPAPDQPTA